MQVRKLIDSFNYAIEGLVHTFKTQRNMRIHFIIAILTLMMAIFVQVSKIHLVLLFLTITLVIFAEMINTAIETVVNIVSPHYHPLAKIAKNVAAGAVLVTALNALAVGYLIFFDKIHEFSFRLTEYAKTLPVHLTFASLAIVLLVVIIAKALSQRGTFLRGGLPSGHSALAFSLLASVTLIGKNALITTLCTIMAVLVAQSRLESGIHTFFEVLMGALIGLITTVLIFQLFFHLV